MHLGYDGIVRRLLPDVEFHQNRYARELDRCVGAGICWLDLGAGTRIHAGWLGPDSEELAGRAKQVWGCDLVIRHLASNRYLSGAVGAHAARLPFPDGQFDLVTANMVVEHLPKPEVVFAEIARVLRPGGRFVFVTSNRRHPVVWIFAALVPRGARRRLAHWIEGRPIEHIFPTYYRANTPRAVLALSRKVGLKPQHVTTFPSYPIFRRPWLLTLLEALWIRTLRWRPLRFLSSNLLACLSKELAILPAASGSRSRKRRT